MSLSAAEIAQVVASLQGLVGAVVQKLWLPEPKTVVLRLRGGGRTCDLLISAEPGLARLHLLVETRRPRGEPTPAQAVLRRALEGRRLTAIEQWQSDRVVGLCFEGRAGESRTLVAELTGVHGNLFLLDGTGRILHTAVPN
ncbi:MAG: hypothetical protein D6729_06795, partial [Deltaproteobacteria bacterium]